MGIGRSQPRTPPHPLTLWNGASSALGQGVSQGHPKEGGAIALVEAGGKADDCDGGNEAQRHAPVLVHPPVGMALATM